DRVMTEILPPRPFFRQMYADRDDLVGARWWQESLQRSAPDRISRRNALLALALTLGPAAGGGLLAWLLSQSDEVDITMDALDVQGPTSVAVAAGMAPGFDPVFVLDNWPHPLGVVPSHLTLGAVLYYRPLFMRLRGSRTGRAPPVFVLDRNRLARYTDEETQFDNRY